MNKTVCLWMKNVKYVSNLLSLEKSEFKYILVIYYLEYHTYRYFLSLIISFHLFLSQTSSSHWAGHPLTSSRVVSQVLTIISTAGVHRGWTSLSSHGYLTLPAPTRPNCLLHKNINATKNIRCVVNDCCIFSFDIEWKFFRRKVVLSFWVPTWCCFKMNWLG